MKKIIILAIIAASVHLRVSGQNSPIGAIGSPTTPTRAIASLPALFTPTSAGSFNYTRVIVPLCKISSTSSPFFSRTIAGPCGMVTNYANGFGETIETISRVQGTGAHDIVSINDLRNSLNSFSFSPYVTAPSSQFQASAFVDQRAYFSAAYPDEGGRSYNETLVSYPGGVPTTESFAPGASFTGQGNGTKVTAIFNTAIDAIVIYNVSPTGIVSTPTPSTYAPNQLSVKVTQTPHNGETHEFADKNGRIICKKTQTNASGAAHWQTTYYLYNDMGELVHILTPKGTQALGTSGAPFTSVSTLTYTNDFNEFGSITAKSVPGQIGKNYVVYDVKNRPVLSQTPAMAAQSTPIYSFTLYDSRDRVVISGYFASALPYTYWQNELTPASGTTAGPYALGSLEDFLLNGVPGTYPSSIPDCEIDQVNFYDKYEIPKTFSYAYASAASSLAASMAVAYTPYMFTQGLLTCSITRVNVSSLFTEVLSSTGGPSDSWTASVFFYDKSGQIIQVQSLNPKWPETFDNCKAGASTVPWDLLTSKYDFSGHKVVDVLEHHDKDGSGGLTTSTVENKYVYDYYNGARLRYTEQTIDGGGAVMIANYIYDDLGNIKQKSLGGVEFQNYDYNLRGQLTTINRDYTNNECSPQATTSTFGLVIGYDFDFNSPRYDGSISGIKWRGASHSTPLRSYGYEYDAAGRLNHAEFRHLCEPTSNSITPCISSGGETWNKVHTDFTSSNITYDDNGNLKTLFQMGATASTGASLPTPQLIDHLIYNYHPVSDKLDNVADGATYHLAGNEDFKDASASSCGGTPCPDYDYDNDGNLIADANKSITSITYNAADQPLKITFANGSTISNIYDADGGLVRKKINDATTSITPIPEYSYCGPYTYRNDVPESILHQEGRSVYTPSIVAAAAAAATTPYPYTYEYFVKDHLGNVRTVVSGYLTNAPRPPLEGTNPGDASSGGLTMAGGYGKMGNTTTYIATHEASNAAVENAIFANIDNVRSGKQSSIDPVDQYEALLNGGDSARRIGTSIMLRVMPGDTFDVAAQSYYEDTSITDFQSTRTMMDAFVGTLAGMNSANTGEAGNQLVNASMNNINYDAYDAIMAQNTDFTAPRAYINYLFFDEEMVFHPELSGAIQITKGAGQWQLMGSSKMGAKMGGYVVLATTAISTMPIAFDGFTVNLYHGGLIQENHYYPFGLTVNMASATGGIKNKIKYQGKELQDDLGLNLYDFTARQYDPQIGRFWGIDPAEQFPSGYTGMGNDPANQIDPSGCWSNGGMHDNTNGGSTTPYYGGAPRAGFNESSTPWYEDPAVIASAKTDWAIFVKKIRSERDNGVRYNPIDDRLEKLVYFGYGVPGTAYWLQSKDGNYTHVMNEVVTSYRWEPLEDVSRSIGQPGIMEGCAPVWGDGRSAIDYFQNGHYILGGFFTALAVADAISLGGTTEIGAGIRAGKAASRVFEVGSYRALKGVEVGLDAHHVGQKALMAKLIPGYNLNTAPAILVPKLGHTEGINVLSRITEGLSSAREVLARDIFELRRVYPDIPNSSLQQLIQMNKTMYPGAFIK